MEWIISVIGAVLVGIISLLAGKVRKQRAAISEAQEAEEIALIRAKVQEIGSEVLAEISEGIASQVTEQREIDRFTAAKEESIKADPPEVQADTYNEAVQSFNSKRRKK